MYGCPAATAHRTPGRVADGVAAEDPPREAVGRERPVRGDERDSLVDAATDQGVRMLLVVRAEAVDVSRQGNTRGSLIRIDVEQQRDEGPARSRSDTLSQSRGPASATPSSAHCYAVAAV